MRITYAVILIMALLAALAVAGCVCCGGSSRGPDATPVGPSSTSPPEKPGDLTDMKYLWNNVHYLKQSATTSSTILDMNGQETTLTWKLSDSNYKGLPAKLLTIVTNSTADIAKADNSFSFNMSFDIYFSKAGDILTMLGGQSYMQLGEDPEDIMQGEINVSQLIENSRIIGTSDPDTGEPNIEKGPARFSPTIDLSSPIKPISDPNELENAVQTGYDLNKLMSGGSATYHGFGNVTLTPAGRETVKVGNKNIDCNKYTWTVNIGKDRADYTAWYSPEFPAMPLKMVTNINNGQTVQTSLVEAWN